MDVMSRAKGAFWCGNDRMEKGDYPGAERCFNEVIALQGICARMRADAERLLAETAELVSASANS